MAEPPQDLQERLRSALGALTLEHGVAARPKQSYAFWGTQPVAQFNEDPSSAQVGAIQGARRSLAAAAPTGGRQRTAALFESARAPHSQDDGPIDEPKTVQDVRQEPYNLPPG